MQNNGGFIYFLCLNDFPLIAAAVTDRHIYGLGSSGACMLECLASVGTRECKLWSTSAHTNCRRQNLLKKKKVIFLCHFLLLFARVIEGLILFSFKFDLLIGLVLRNKMTFWATILSCGRYSHHEMQKRTRCYRQQHKCTAPGYHHC